ncbi:MAG: ion transporter [Deltaproteobacteria bacterium]|nr:ion transporter [Deltaproteobacteria bacterium]
MGNRTRVWEIVEVSGERDSTARIFDAAILSLILLNITAVILETVESVYSVSPRFFRIFEWVSVLAFTIEYLARLWSCTADPRFATPVTGRLRFMFRPMMIVDLVAIVPFFLASYGYLRVVRVFRLLRLFRILKVARYSLAVRTMGRVVRAKREELLVAVFVLTMLLVVAAALIYTTEHEAQPIAFSSIPDAMWWAVATLTTIGYGDVRPVTAAGKLIASFVAIMGIALFALPAGILASGFMEEMASKKTVICPHCGKEHS